MSNELVDEPMDAEAPETPAADPTNGRDSLEPAVPNIPGEMEDGENAHDILTSKSRQLLDIISNSLGGNLQPEKEKRDKETFDEKYDLIVNESAVDVEAIGCCYAGNAFFVRGRFIVKHCPSLRTDMYCGLIQYLRDETKDTHHYQAFFNELELELGKSNAVANVAVPVKDAKWIEETFATWNASLDGLQADYKRHKDEGVKESTRRAMEDLFQHFLAAGKTEEAIRLYSRGIRDYCTQLKHSINMWLNWIEISIIANEWSRLESVTATASRSLKDADEAEKNSHGGSFPPRGENATFMVEREATQLQAALSNRQLIETALAKCQAAQTLLKLRHKKYAEVVELVLSIKTEHLEPKWFVTSSDLGIYAMLCAMATMERAELKSSVGGSGAFRKLLEAEPQFIELLNSYTSSRFGRCFEIMYSVKSRLLLDPFISREVDNLFNLIRQKCIVQYMQPYSTVKMETMCSALGSTIQELQTSLVELIETKGVSIRIDQSEGLIRMIDDKNEEMTLRRVNETCERAVLRAKSLLWKTTLVGANLHSISEKELRQKRKNAPRASGTTSGGAQGGGASVDSEEQREGRAEAFNDDFQIAFQDANQFLDDLGDI